MVPGLRYIPGAKKRVADGPLPREIFRKHHSTDQAMKVKGTRAGTTVG